MVAVKKRKYGSMQNSNKPIRDAPKLSSKSRSAVLNSSASLVASSLHRSVCLHVGSGHQLVGVWSEHYTFVLQK